MIFAISVIYSRYEKFKVQQPQLSVQEQVKPVEMQETPETTAPVATNPAASKQQPQQKTGEVKLRNILFQFKSATARSVALIGDFNSWQPAQMQKKGNAWEVAVKVKPGVYDYNYQVDGKIVLDPNNKKPPVTTKRGHKSSTIVIIPL